MGVCVLARSRAASTKDVAALAGVSIGTVSNVVNAPHKVSEATRRKVTDAIEELGWKRNEAARQLRAGRSKTIGMVLLDLANPYFTGIIKGAEEVLYEAGYMVTVGNSDQQLARENLLLANLGSSRVAGALLSPISADLQEAVALRREGIPVVLIDRAEAEGIPGVSGDNVLGGTLAVEHLLAQGYRRIGFAGGADLLFQVRDRLQGARDAIAASRTDAELLEFPTKTLDLAAGRSVGMRILEMPLQARPRAVFCANDLIAIGLQGVLLAGGLRVPEDLAIIGYDDIDFAPALAVPLSSVRQPSPELGRLAAQLLLAEVDPCYSDAPSDLGRQVLVRPTVIARRSTVLRPS